MDDKSTLPYAYISYITGNIGDDIQALAARQFLTGAKKDVIHHINREFIAVPHPPSEQRVCTIINGFWGFAKDVDWGMREPPPDMSWPPAQNIHALIISFHITPRFAQHIFSESGIAYLKAHAPIGARDLHTVELLNAHQIPCYFSGCLTLSLKRSDYLTPRDALRRDNFIYVVDIIPEIVEFIKRTAKQAVVIELSHSVDRYQFANNDARLDYATTILQKYANAKCVVSSRLHAVLPCLAFDTPTLFVHNNLQSGRFDGLLTLLHYCTPESLLQGEWSAYLKKPFPNKNLHIPLVGNMFHTIRQWIKTCENV